MRARAPRSQCPATSRVPKRIHSWPSCVREPPKRRMSLASMNGICKTSFSSLDTRHSFYRVSSFHRWTDLPGEIRLRNIATAHYRSDKRKIQLSVGPMFPSCIAVASGVPCSRRQATQFAGSCVKPNLVAYKGDKVTRSWET